MKMLDWLERQPKVTLIGFGFLFLGALWLIDCYAKPDLSFLIFYFVPIFLTAWFVGKKTGLAMSLLSVAAWISADDFSRGPYSHPLVPFWNLGIKAGVFLGVSYLFSALREYSVREGHLARVDGLTGVANRRSFMETCALEIQRAHRYRHPLSLAYLDVDHFKELNDRSGHDQGDAALIWMSRVIETHLRSIDLLARLGGDEFVILLPEMPAFHAQQFTDKIRAVLEEAVLQTNFGVTFSVGMVSFAIPPYSVDKILKHADEAMYEAKRRVHAKSATVSEVPPLYEHILD